MSLEIESEGADIIDNNGLVIESDGADIIDNDGLVIEPHEIIHTLFNGSNEFVNLGNNASVSFDWSDTFTYSMWIKGSDLGTVSSEIILGKRLHPTLAAIALYVSGVNPQHLRFLMRATLISAIGVESTGLITLNEWVHVACTNDGSGLASGVEVYVNGVNGKTILHDDLLGNSVTTTGDLCIGSYDANVANFSGGIDEVLITNDAKTQMEILDIFKRGRDYPDYTLVTNKVAHIRMDEVNPPDEVGVNNGTSINMDNTNIIIE